MSQVIPETPSEYDDNRIIERPDGFYWESRDEGRERGPFATLLDAERDMQFQEEEDGYEPGETLEEAESEIGIADWVDADTGQPAEDGRPRLEDH